MLERVSQCIFQLDKADAKIAGTISLEWGSRDTARGFPGTARSNLQFACASGEGGRPALATALFEIYWTRWDCGSIWLTERLTYIWRSLS